jgi:protoheme IX farnesyltransferase
MHTAMTMTVSILKLRIGSFVALAALVGILTGGGPMGWIEAAVFTLAVLGASGAAGAFNQYFERDTDRLMARTFNRPFATGQLKEGAIWPLTFTALLAVSIVMAWSVGGTLAAVLVFFGAFTYAVVYTLWLKKRTVWNVVIGGAAGSFALLAGAAAAASPFGPAIGPVPILLAVVLFLWTPPHFWALAALRAEDYRRADIPMLPAVTGPETWGPAIFFHVLALVALSFGPLFYGLGLVYGLCAAVAGAWFLLTSWRLMREPSRQAARATFLASLAHFALLSLGVMADRGLAWAL